jgi:hypothetical protein
VIESYSPAGGEGTCGGNLRQERAFLNYSAIFRTGGIINARHHQIH